MLATFEQTRYGGFTATPVSNVLINRIVKYLEQWNVTSNGTAYVQGDDEAAYWIPKRRVAEFREGYAVTVRVDAWEFLHLYGWDAHEGVNW